MKDDFTPDVPISALFRNRKVQPKPVTKPAKLDRYERYQAVKQKRKAQ